MQPDAIPIHPVRSYVVLPGDMIDELFGTGFRLRGTELVEAMQRGKLVGMLDVVQGDEPALFLDAGDLSRLSSDRLKLRGPQCHIPAPPIRSIAAELVLPPGLLGAWNLSIGQQTTVALGNVAVRVTVSSGDAPCLRVDRCLPLSGGLGLDGFARWIPDVAWLDARVEPADDSTQLPSSKRIITENDVRRARMLRKRIRVRNGQIITPAARDLAEELGMLDDG